MVSKKKLDDPEKIENDVKGRNPASPSGRGGGEAGGEGLGMTYEIEDCESTFFID